MCSSEPESQSVTAENTIHIFYYRMRIKTLTGYQGVYCYYLVVDSMIASIACTSEATFSEVKADCSS